MRFPILTLAVACSLGMTGCSNLVSLNPFHREQQSNNDPALVGTWVDKESICIIRQDGAGYAITYINDGVMKFGARMVIVGNARVLDLVSKDEHPFHLAPHVLARVWLDGNTLRWSFLDSDWLQEQAAKQLPAQRIGDALVLSSSSGAAWNFLMKAATDDRAVHETHDFEKQ